MAHARKPVFVFRRNGRVHLNRRGASVQSTTGSRVVRISGSNAGYTMFRGGVKSAGYPLHSSVSPSLPLPCVTVCHHISTGVYNGRIWSSDYSPPFIVEVMNAWIYTSILAVTSYLINYKTNFYQKSHKVTLTWKAPGQVSLMCLEALRVLEQSKQKWPLLRIPGR